MQNWGTKQDGSHAKQRRRWILLIVTFVITVFSLWLSKLQAAKAKGCKVTSDLSNIQSCHSVCTVKADSRSPVYFFIVVQKKRRSGEGRVCVGKHLIREWVLNRSKCITTSSRRIGCATEGLPNYRLVIMTAWQQLSATVWVSYKQECWHSGAEVQILWYCTLEIFFFPGICTLLESQPKSMSVFFTQVFRHFQNV